MKTKLLKRFFILSILNLSILNVYSQTNYRVEGVIIDSATNTPIDFVNIGIIGKDLGTVANNSGYFHLYVQTKFSRDSLTVTRLGYISKSLKISELLKERVNYIYLIPKNIELGPVQIEANKLTIKTIGKQKSTKSAVMGFNSDSTKLGHEFGIVFHLPNNPVLIKDFNFYIVNNRPDSAKLRLNIYRFINNEIGESILDKPINFTITNSDIGDYKIDLSKYKIWSSQDVFIAIENLKIYVSHGPDPNIKFDKFYYDRINISLAMLGSKAYERNVSLGGWVKLSYIYSPSYWITILK
jgi:hypothetical protein